MEKGMYVVLIVAVVAIVVLVVQSGSQNSYSDVTGLSVATPCTDSDGGINLGVQGTTVGQLSATSLTYTRADSCVGASVKEFSCNAVGFVAQQIFACPVGQTCYHGACVLPAVMPDLIAFPARRDIFLSGDVYVVNKQVSSFSYSVTAQLTCSIVNQGGSAASGTNVNNRCNLYDTPTTSLTGMGAHVASLSPSFNLAPSGSYTFTGTTMLGISNFNVPPFLQQLYETGTASAYLWIYADYYASIPRGRVFPEASENNNLIIFPITITPSMYNINFIDVDCVANTDCPTGQSCVNYACV